MEPADLPPPYTPQDPLSTTDPSATSEHSVVQHATSQLSLRGGCLRERLPDELQTEDQFASAATYFEDRPFHGPPGQSVLVVVRDVSPDTRRGDLQHPLIPSQRATRDITDQDWATFVNYLLAELGADGEVGQSDELASKGQRSAMTPEEFVVRKGRMEAVVAEWNAAFFKPRGTRLNVRYSIGRAASPVPSYRTVQSAQGDVAGHTPSSPLPGSPFSALEAGPTSPQYMRGWPMGPHRGQFGSRGGFLGHPFGAPEGPFQLHGGPFGPHAGPFGPPRSPFAPNGVPYEMPGGPQFHLRGGPRGRAGGHGRRGSYGRGHHGHHGLPDAHYNLPDAPDDLDRFSESRRRSSSVSSTLSWASDSDSSSVSSIESSDFSDAGVEVVRLAVEKFRIDPDKKDDLKGAIHRFHEDLKSRCEEERQNPGPSTPVSRGDRKAAAKAIKSELRELGREVRDIKRAKKRERKELRRQKKAERKALRQLSRTGRASSSASGAPPTPVTTTSEQPQGVFESVAGLPTPPPEYPDEKAMLRARDEREAAAAAASMTGLPNPLEPTFSTASSSNTSVAEDPNLSRCHRQTERWCEWNAKNLEATAVHHERHAKHWDNHAVHWENHIAQQARQNSDREVKYNEREVGLEEAVRVRQQDVERAQGKRDRMLEKSIEARTRELEKCQKEREKRLAKAIKDKAKVEKIAKHAREMAMEQREKARVQRELAGHQRAMVSTVRSASTATRSGAPAMASPNQPPRELPYYPQRAATLGAGGPAAASLRAAATAPFVRAAAAHINSRRASVDDQQGVNYFERLGRNMGTWGERFGRDMETWGERFGRDMEAWGERVGQEATAAATGSGGGPSHHEARRV